MTDRRVGSADLTVEVVPTPSRQIGAISLTVEYAAVINRQTGAVGVNVDLQRTGITLNRQTGAVGVDVDLQRTNITLNRQTGAVGVIIDLKTLPPATPVTVTASQATSVSLQATVISGGPVTYPITVVAVQPTALARLVQRGVLLSTAQSQTVALGRAVSLMRRVTQAQQVGLRGAASRVLAITQSTSVRLVRQARLSRTLAQAQIATAAFGRGYQRTLTTTQSMTVRLTKSVRLMRRLTGTHVVQTSVRLSRVVGRLLRATSVTSPRLVKQIRLTRAITQAQSTTLVGVPVQLLVISTVQTRSLALGRNVFLSRLIAQAQALVLKSDLSLARTAVQPTLATLQRAVNRVVAVSVSTVATLEWRNVTPRYDILVTASVSQQVSLSSAGAGKTAKQFVVDTRRVEFVVGQRSSGFAVGRRGVRFTVEER